MCSDIWNVSYIELRIWNHVSYHLAGHLVRALNVSGFIVQLVRASHRYREVTGSNPVEVLTFSGFSMQLFITAMIMAYLISNPQFNICNISYITSHNNSPKTLILKKHILAGLTPFIIRLICHCFYQVHYIHYWGYICY